MLQRHQSFFRAHHSTERAVLKVMSDILTVADQGRVMLLRLLDMSAAFDTVDHDILLRRLETSFGLTGSVISWLSSFLCGRTQQVIFNNLESTITKVTSGVPQGSVLGPLLFLLYTAASWSLRWSITWESTAMLMMDSCTSSTSAGGADFLVLRVNVCIAEIDKWMSSNRIELWENTIYMVGRSATAKQGQYQLHQSSWQHGQLSI